MKEKRFMYVLLMAMIVGVSTTLSGTQELLLLSSQLKRMTVEYMQAGQISDEDKKMLAQLTPQGLTGSEEVTDSTRLDDRHIQKGVDLIKSKGDGKYLLVKNMLSVFKERVEPWWTYVTQKLGEYLNQSHKASTMLFWLKSTLEEPNDILNKLAGICDNEHYVAKGDRKTVCSWLDDILKQRDDFKSRITLLEAKEKDQKPLQKIFEDWKKSVEAVQNYDDWVAAGYVSFGTLAALLEIDPKGALQALVDDIAQKLSFLTSNDIEETRRDIVNVMRAMYGRIMGSLAWRDNMTRQVVQASEGVHGGEDIIPGKLRAAEHVIKLFFGEYRKKYDELMDHAGSMFNFSSSLQAFVKGGLNAWVAVGEHIIEYVFQKTPQLEDIRHEYSPTAGTTYQINLQLLYQKERDIAQMKIRLKASLKSFAQDIKSVFDLGEKSLNEILNSIDQLGASELGKIDKKRKGIIRAQTGF